MKKLLVIQFRTDKSEAHEQDCFKKMLKGQSVDLSFVNIIKSEVDLLELDNYNGIVLGGSGEFYVSKDLDKEPWFDRVNALIKTIEKNNIPTLGICFGFQLLGVYYGAKVIEDKKMREVGGFNLYPLPLVQGDPVFGHLPEKFYAHLGHKETVIDIPDNLISMAKSDRVKCEAFKVKDKPIWACLFHAELDEELMRERFFLYYDSGVKGYAEDGVEKIVGSFGETKEAEKVLLNFVNTL